MELDERMRQVAERQHGVISRAQARQLGATRAQLARRRSGPDWEAVTPRVLRVAGAPQSAHQLAMAAVLDAGPGAVLGLTSAAWAWRLPGFSLRPLVCTRERRRSGSTPALARLHRPRYLPPNHLTEVQGIPVPTLPRLLFDLAGVLPLGRTARTLDTVLASSPALLPVLHRMLPELARHGRDGITAMRTLLGERPVGMRLPASALERRFEEIVRPLGIRLRRQVDVGGAEWVGRVDYLDELGILYEVDSERYHLAPSDALRDAARDAALLAAGFAAVVRIPEEDIWHHPERIVAAVLAARRRTAAAA